MEALTMAGQLLLGLGLLVFIHELGHFLAARAFGIRVEKFYIFFDFGGFKLLSKKIGDTEYGIGWFPLGGYVKISGMIDESMDKEQMALPPQDWEFRSKPAWQRFIVMIGGIVMNVILGVLIFAFVLYNYKGSYVPPENIKDGIYAYDLGRKVGLQTGDKILTINGNPARREVDINSMRVFFGAELGVERNGQLVNVDLPDELFMELSRHKDRFVGFDNFAFTVDSAAMDGPAELAGIQGGDKIVSLNDRKIRVYGDLKEEAALLAGKSVELTINRQGEEIRKEVTINEAGLLGVYASPDDPYEREHYTIANAFYFGTKDGLEAIIYNALGIGKIFTGKIKATESVQSPIGIAKIYGGTWQWSRFWYITGMVSFILAFMNLLPIPALDGGHVVFIIIEVIQGKPVSEKVLERAQVVGMVMVLALMVFAFGNDIYKLFAQ